VIGGSVKMPRAVSHAFRLKERMEQIVGVTARLAGSLWSERGARSVPVALFGVSPNSLCGRLPLTVRWAGANGNNSSARRRERSRRPRSPSSTTSVRL